MSQSRRGFSFLESVIVLAIVCLLFFIAYLPVQRAMWFKESFGVSAGEAVHSPETRVLYAPLVIKRISDFEREYADLVAERKVLLESLPRPITPEMASATANKLEGLNERIERAETKLYRAKLAAAQYNFPEK